jgi:hypothetical protein
LAGTTSQGKGIGRARQRDACADAGPRDEAGTSWPGESSNEATGAGLRGGAGGLRKRARSPRPGRQRASTAELGDRRRAGLGDRGGAGLGDWCDAGLGGPRGSCEARDQAGSTNRATPHDRTGRAGLSRRPRRATPRDRAGQALLGGHSIGLIALAAKA